MSIFYSMNLENVAKSRPLCRPAFSSARQALSFVAFAMGTLVVPMIFSMIWPIESWRIYRGVPAHFGNYSHIGDVIAGGGEYDIVVIGASDGQTCIDTPLLAEAMSAHLGRPAKVVNLSSSWAGEDRHHQILADFYKAGGTATLVIGFENDALQRSPHELAKYWWRQNSSSAGLSFRSRTQLYMQTVIGTPRRIWLRLQGAGGPTATPQNRRNAEIIKNNLGYQPELRGFKSHYEPDSVRREVIEREFEPVAVDFATHIFTKESEDSFVWQYYGHSEFFTHFQKKTYELVTSNGGMFYAVQAPLYFKQEALEKVVIRPLYENEPRSWGVIGVSQAELFPDLEFDEMRSFYLDESHLNIVGARHFTQTLTPIFESLLTR